MNVWQVARQLAYRLRADVWPDGLQRRTFASVHITAGPAPETAGRLRTPFALVHPTEAEADDEAPNLLRQRFEIVLATFAAGDEIGENVLVGANRTGGQGSSEGRGLLELEERARALLENVDQTAGIALRLVAIGAAEAAVVEGLGYVATRTLTFEAWLVSARYYHPLLRLTATNLGGAARIAWALSPDRFDRRQVVLRRAAGAVPPASPTAGTGVALGGNLVTQVDDAAGAGQFSYAGFMGYDETSSATNERFSAASTATVTVT